MFTYRNFTQCQIFFDQWRDIYNNYRRHESLKMGTPCEHSQPSIKPFPKFLQPITCPPGYIVLKVDRSGFSISRINTMALVKYFGILWLAFAKMRFVRISLMSSSAMNALL